MQTLQGLLLAESATAPDHRATMVHPHLEHLLQAHGVRTPVDQRHVVHREVVLQWRVLEQLRQNRVRVEARLELDDQTRAVMAIGQVDGAGDALQLVVLHAFGDALQHAFRPHHERQLRHDDGLLAGGHVLDMRHRSCGERAPARLVRFANAVAAHDHAAAGPVGAGHITHQLLQRGVRMAHEVLRRGHHLADIVRRHVRRHADRDAGAAIDQQVRNRRGQHRRLLKLVVVIRREIDGVLVDVGVHAKRSRSHARLGVTRRRGTIVQRAEITMAVDQRQSHGERLGQTHHGLVNGGIAMRMELAHHLADHTGRFHIRAVRIQIHLAHLIDDAPLHRLQTIPGIGQSAGVNHRIRVFEERFAHLLVQRRFDDMLLDRMRVIGGFCRSAVRHHAVILLTER